MFRSLSRWNSVYLENKRFLSDELCKSFRASVNSYLGTLKSFSTYQLRKKLLLSHMTGYVRNQFYISGGYRKVVKKRISSLD